MADVRIPRGITQITSGCRSLPTLEEAADDELVRFASESFAAAVEGWIIATDAGFEPLHDCGMAFGTAKEMCEAYAGGVVRICG